MFVRKERVVIFIDGSNLYHELLTNFKKANINFSKFADFLAGKNQLVKVFYYNAPLIQSSDQVAYQQQQKFFSSIKNIQKFELKLGRLEKRPNGSPVEKGVDVRMAVDIVTIAFSNEFDIGVVVSGDADFVPAIKVAQDAGKKIFNVCFPKTKSFHLNQICNETIFINKDQFEKLCWEKRAEHTK